jgi:hypothetical protein
MRTGRDCELSRNERSRPPACSEAHPAGTRDDCFATQDEGGGLDHHLAVVLVDVDCAAGAGIHKS